MFRTPKMLVPAVAAAAALFVVGCGGSSKSSSNTGASSTPAPAAVSTTPSSGGAAAGSSTLKLSADPSQLKFDKSTLSAKAGTVTLTMDNPSALPHAIAVQGTGVNKVGQTVQKGGTSTVTANVKAGTYTFYCPVDGHRAAGMQGTLTVS